MVIAVDWDVKQIYQIKLLRKLILAFYVTVKSKISMHAVRESEYQIVQLLFMNSLSPEKRQKLKISEFLCHNLSFQTFVLPLLVKGKYSL